MKIIIAFILAVVAATNLHESYPLACMAILAVIAFTTVYLYFGKSKELDLIDYLPILFVCFMALTVSSVAIAKLPIDKQVTAIMSIYLSLQMLGLLNFLRKKHCN